MPVTRSRKWKAYPVMFFMSAVRTCLKFTVFSEKPHIVLRKQSKGHRVQNQVLYLVLLVFV